MIMPLDFFFAEFFILFPLSDEWCKKKKYMNYMHNIYCIVIPLQDLTGTGQAVILIVTKID